MRIVLDTSVLISYLRSRTPETSSAAAILGAAARGSVALLSVDGVVEELVRTVDGRRDLAARIAPSDVEAVVDLVRDIGEPVDQLPEPYPKVGRDRDDYFLIAHAVFAGATHLVSWDNDPLDLDPLDDLRLVTPPQFLTILRDAGLL